MNMGFEVDISNKCGKQYPFQDRSDQWVALWFQPHEGLVKAALHRQTAIGIFPFKPSEDVIAIIQN